MNIIVTIPKSQIAKVEAEEAEVAAREANGELGICYYWEMGRLPNEDPGRIYFVWNGAVRAYHEIIGCDRDAGRIYMKTKIHMLDSPVEMKSFMGFRYYNG